ncbi:GNAT family N-acetyltransferase [Peptostreptococcaceae bacterium OttesenSCG-928-C18]|nr:GNAT family N-acetyltransferase [Peptostreptococcaceae bacterium OttesenSCG-928-C18]
MLNIRYANENDATFWFKLDKHISKKEFLNKVKNKMGYVILKDDIPIGLLRYNLFWDNTPFCTMLYIDSNFQNKGYGKINEFLGKRYEKVKLRNGYDFYSSRRKRSTFYRKLGFSDAGCLIIDIPKYKQPMEIFFIKELQ